MQAQTLTTRRLPDRRTLIWGLTFGVLFGFLLQKGGVTKYDVIIGQLLLEDFTVLKVMLAAVLTGMIGVYAMKSRGWVQLHLKSGSVGMNVIGGLIFGIGFGILGFCPGTVAGAIGNGYLDALVGGLSGILVGSGLFAALYPRLSRGVLRWGYFGDVTLPQVLRVNEWVVVVSVAALIVSLLLAMEWAGV